jgi:hypothetical protein
MRCSPRDNFRKDYLQSTFVVKLDPHRTRITQFCAVETAEDKSGLQNCAGHERSWQNCGTSVRYDDNGGYDAEREPHEPSYYAFGLLIDDRGTPFDG